MKCAHLHVATLFYNNYISFNVVKDGTSIRYLN